MKKIIISAIAQNKVIGDKKTGMLWDIKEEFKHFKDTTFGFPIIMGRRTFRELGKPLKGRLNIVVSHLDDHSIQYENTVVVSNFDEAFEYCELQKFPKVFIIGGGEIYKQGIKIADEMILSYMKFAADGDVLFPDYDQDEWNVVKTEERDLFTIKTLVRKQPK